MQPLAGILRKRRRHVVVGREADPEIPGGKVGGRDAGREHKAATITQFLQIRVTRFIVSVPAEQFRPDQPPDGKRIGQVKAGSRRAALQIIVLRHAIDGHLEVRHGKTPAHADIGRGEPCPLRPDRRPGLERSPHPRGRQIGAGRSGHTDRKTEERRPAEAVVHKLGLADMQPFVLEYQVCEEIAELRGEDTDTGADHHVAHPVAVIELARNAGDRRHGIGPDAVPRAAVPVLLVEHRRRHENRGRMPRGKRIAACGPRSCAP